MYIRRLVKAGIASFTIALPKEWVVDNKLAKGDSVYIKRSSANELVLSTELKAQKPSVREITIETDNKALGTISRELTSAYVNNIGTVTIVGRELYRHAKQIREMLNSFVALEVTEQTASKIVAKDMLSLQEVSVEKTVRRMDNIVRSLFKDLMHDYSEDMFESVTLRDGDIDRLYFLLFKMTKIALSDQVVAQQIGLEHRDALSIWYLILNVESISDALKEVYMTCLRSHDAPLLRDFAPFFSVLEQNYCEVMKAYYQDDRKSADAVASRRNEVMETIGSILAKNDSAAAAKLAENVKEIENLICNLARVVLDKE